MSEADLELQIDELVASGLSEAEAHRLAGAIERHLGLLYAADELPRAGGAIQIDHLDAGATRPARAGGGGDALAAQVAGQVYATVKGGPR
jgi:hypothetical protein